MPEGLVDFQRTVGYEESLDLMTSAHGLLVIDAPAAESVFLPSKLVDYIGAGRPVLGMTPPGTATRLITELGGWVSDPADPEQTQKALADFIGFIRDNKDAIKRGWGEPSGTRAIFRSASCEEVRGNCRRTVVLMLTYSGSALACSNAPCSHKVKVPWKIA